jgi:hypothetical protein
MWTELAPLDRRDWCNDPGARAASSQAARSPRYLIDMGATGDVARTQRTFIGAQRIKVSPSIRRNRAQNLKASRLIAIDERPIAGSLRFMPASDEEGRKPPQRRRIEKRDSSRDAA